VKRNGGFALQSIKKSDEIKFNLVGACIVRPAKSAKNKSGRPMVAPTKRQEVLSNFNPSDFGANRRSHLP